MEAHKRGDLTEAKVIAEFASRGIPVSIPFGDNDRYDLLARTEDGRLLRIQVKTGRSKDGVVVFDGKSQHANSTETRYESYREDVDYFTVFCHELESMYFVPADEVGSTNHLRVEEPDHDYPRINWAEEYEFDRCWPGPSGENRPDRDLPPNRRGDATEATVIAKLLKRDIAIAAPLTDNERYDLLVSSPTGDFLRIQIKTGWVAQGSIQFQSVSSHTNGQGTVYKPYDGDIDYFLVYAPTRDEMYLVGESEFNSRISLRVEPTKRAYRDTNWAEEYSFDTRWPPDEQVLPETNPWYQLKKSAIGALEAIGSSPSIPADDSDAWDLVAELPGGGFVRLKMRKASEKDGRLYVPPGEKSGADYDLVYCYDRDQWYLLNVDEYDGALSLRLEEPEQVRRSTKWAEDYELERVWPPTPGRTISYNSPVGAGIQAFREEGATVAIPENQDLPYDFLVTVDEKDYYRVRVEPGWISHGRIRLKPDSCDGIDWFLLYCRENETAYLVEADEFDRSISLRVEPAENEVPSIKWAEAYKLSPHLHEITETDSA